MKSFSHLCPQCQRPLISNEMYCRWCNTYLPEARPNMTSTFSPPPPQYVDLSGQNRTQTGLMQDFPGEKVLSSQQPRSASQKLKRPLLAGGIVGVCLLLIASFLFGKNLGTNGNASTRAALPTNATTSTQTTLISVTPTSSIQDTPTSVAPTSLPTASLSSPQLPLSISCVNCPYPQLTITLNRITVDSPARSTRWNFSILNSGQHPCSSLSFWTSHLTDASGTNYSGEGQASSGNSFAIDVGQSVQETPVFAILPASSAQYTLTLEIYVGGCNVSSSVNTYQTENFTFA